MYQVILGLWMIEVRASAFIGRSLHRESLQIPFEKMRLRGGSSGPGDPAFGAIVEADGQLVERPQLYRSQPVRRRHEPVHRRICGADFDPVRCTLHMRFDKGDRARLSAKGKRCVLD